jgi:hypothetical protein
MTVLVTVRWVAAHVAHMMRDSRCHLPRVTIALDCFSADHARAVKLTFGETP